MTLNLKCPCCAYTETVHDERSAWVVCPRRFAGARGYAAALEYATRLATGMWERDWKEESPHWQPFDDLVGVLSQIDNMLAGMEKKKRHNPTI
jgi:hypothetical protein